MAVNSITDISGVKPAPDIKASRPSMQHVKAMILQVLMLHFADPRNIVDPALKSLIFKPDTTTGVGTVNTKIQITARGKFDPQAIAQRPAVVLKRSGFKIGTDIISGIDQNAVLGDVDDPNLQAVLGAQLYEYPHEGTFIAMCCAREEASAEILADEVLHVLLGIRRFMLERMGMHEFMPQETGEAGILEEADQHWAVPVPIRVAYRSQVVLVPEAPLLKAIQLIQRPV